MTRASRVAILNAIVVSDEGDWMAFNGADRYLVNLCRLLKEIGYEPEVWQAGGKTHCFGDIEIRGLPWGEVEYGSLPELNLQFYERTVGCDRIIYFAPMLAFPRLRPRGVVISHGVFWDYPSQPWATLSGPFKREWLRRLHYAVSAADLFVSVDTNMLNWIRATWPGHEGRQVYIPNFVETDVFRPSGDETERSIVLYPRRLDPGRGFNEAMTAAERLTRKYPRIEFHFVGRGLTEAVEDETRRWAEGNPGCRYYWVPMHEMPEVYHRASIVVIPTKSCEGTSLSCLEAMATGKAIIAGRVGGLTDLIIDGYNGCLIDVTPETLADTIEELLANPEKRRRLGQKARETAESFSLVKWKERWCKALAALWGDPLVGS